MKSAKITNATKTFKDLVAREIKLETSKKKQKKTNTDDNESSVRRGSKESLESSELDKRKEV